MGDAARHVPLPTARLRWGMVLGGVLLVTGASLTPAALLEAAAGGGSGSGGSGGGSPLATLFAVDHLLHALGFGAVAATLALALDAGERAPAAVVGGAVVLAVALGGAVELVQPLVGRTAAWGDLAADAGGAVVAGLLYRVGHRWVRFAG